MKLEQIESLMKMMSENGVGELALDVEGKYAIELRMQGAVVAAPRASTRSQHCSRLRTVA